jgi:hypothetical protein
MDNTISLGMSMATPWTYQTLGLHIILVFLAPLYCCINLERLHLVFNFLFAYFVLNKYTTTYRYNLYL